MTIASVDRAYAFQLGYVVAFNRPVEESCLLTWSDIWENISDDMADYISRTPMDYAPYLFKYRSPASVYVRLERCLREAGIITDIRLRDLREAWQRPRPRR